MLPKRKVSIQHIQFRLVQTDYGFVKLLHIGGIRFTANFDGGKNGVESSSENLIQVFPGQFQVVETRRYFQVGEADLVKSLMISIGFACSDNIDYGLWQMQLLGEYPGRRLLQCLKYAVQAFIKVIKIDTQLLQWNMDRQLR